MSADLHSPARIVTNWLHRVIGSARERLPAAPARDPSPPQRPPAGLRATARSPAGRPDSVAGTVLPEPDDVSLITGLDGPFALPEGLQAFLAISTTGDVFILRNEDQNPDVISALHEYELLQSAQSEAETSLPPLGHRWSVESKFLASVYQIYIGSTRLRALEPMQRRVMERMRDAIEAGASDTHVTWLRGNVEVAYKIHGAMTVAGDANLLVPQAREFQKSAWTLGLGDQGTYNESMPQGRRLYNFDIRSSDGKRRCRSGRLTYLPLEGGEGREMIIRYFVENVDGSLSLAEQGFHPGEHLPMLEIIRDLPYGLVLGVGRVGSGKTTMMGRLLEDRYLARDRQDNIVAVVDLVELAMQGVKQFQVPPLRSGQSMEEAYMDTLRWANRSNPSVLMANEVLDAAAAKFVLQAALAGTLVFTTSHARTIFAAPYRLAEMGLSLHRVCDPETVAAVIGQRLLPKLCDCALPAKDHMELLSEGQRDRLMRTLDRVATAPFPGLYRIPSNPLESLRLPNPGGCDKCRTRFTGHMPGIQGRTVCAEILLSDEATMRHLRTEDPVRARQHWLDCGGHDGGPGRTQLGHAFDKMLQGEIAPSALEGEFGRLDRLHLRDETAHHLR